MQITPVATSRATSSSAPPATPPAAPSLRDLVGTTLIRAVYANDGGVERDVKATWLTSDRVRYADVRAAIRGAQLLQKAQPSKEWDFAIAVVKDPAREGYGLLQLDSSLTGFNAAGVWFQA
ncbi:MAG: hypothetical protein JWM25_1001, partial [Thermoleophilia bacterium]|nr:hypothetical protein [Thermoleophilia bacterium]